MVGGRTSTCRREGGFEGTFITLYSCLFEDRNCKTLLIIVTALGTQVERAGVWR